MRAADGSPVTSPAGSAGHFRGRVAERTDPRIAQPWHALPTTTALPDFRQDTIGNSHSRQSAGRPVVVPPTYITRRFLDYIQPSLSERDLAIITAVARHGLITTQQLLSLFFTHTQSPYATATIRRAQKILQRLNELKFLGRLQRRVGGARAGSAGYIYGIGPAGHRLLELPGEARRIREPLSPHIDHTLCVTQLYVNLVIAQRRGELEVLDHKTEPECWEFAQQQWLKPDAYLRVLTREGQRCRWYLELDRGGPRGAQSERKIQAKLDQYRLFWERQLLAEPVFPRVLLVALHPSRAAQLQALIDRQPSDTQPLFAAVPLDNAVDFIASNGQSAALNAEHSWLAAICTHGLAVAAAHRR